MGLAGDAVAGDMGAAMACCPQGEIGLTGGRVDRGKVAADGSRANRTKGIASAGESGGVDPCKGPALFDGAKVIGKKRIGCFVVGPGSALRPVGYLASQVTGG